MDTTARTLQGLDYAAIGGYMGMLVVLGLVLGRLIKDVGAYFKGGGTLPWPAAALSNFNAMLSTFVFVAYAGIAYRHGLVAITVFWCTVPPTLFAAAVIGRRWRRAGIMTPVEYLEVRFNAPVRQFLGWCGIVFRIVDNMVRLYAIAVFMSMVTPLPREWLIVLSGLVVLGCTVSGGLWSVVLLDVVQFAIIIFATLIMVPLSLKAAGGLSAAMEALPEHFTFRQGPQGELWFLLAYYLMVLIKYNGNWSFIQRFYSVRDERAGRNMALTMAALFFVTPFIFLLPAVLARAVAPGLADPEQAYAAMAVRVLPPGIMGVLMVAMLAATISSVAAEFNVTAGVFTRDVYQRLIRRGASASELMWAARGATLVIGGLVIFGAMFVDRLGGAFDANRVLTGLAIPLSVPLVLGILVRRARPWGALAAVVLGVPTGLVLVFGTQVSWPTATLIVIAVSIGTMLLSGLIPSRDAAYRRRVDEFFTRLTTPVREEEKPESDPAFRRALAMILAAAFVSTGLLFTTMSLPSLDDLSGVLSLAAGAVSLALAAGIYRLAGRRREPERQAVAPVSPPASERAPTPSTA